MRILAVLIFFTAVCFLLFSLNPSNHLFDSSPNAGPPLTLRKISPGPGRADPAISKILTSSEFKKGVLPEIQGSLEKQNSQGLLPPGIANIIQVDWEANINNAFNQEIRNSLSLLANLREKGSKAPPSRLFCSIVHEKNQVMILLSIEDVKSKNRIWELGIAIKKNPTKSL